MANMTPGAVPSSGAAALRYDSIIVRERVLAGIKRCRPACLSSSERRAEQQFARASRCGLNSDPTSHWLLLRAGDFLRVCVPDGAPGRFAGENGLVRSR